MRFLPNPYFVEELRAFTGSDPRVAAFVMDRDDSRDFLELILEMCEFLLPRYKREGKSYLTVALGCTGGKHRSVAMAEALNRELADRGAPSRTSGTATASANNPRALTPGPEGRFIRAPHHLPSGVLHG